MDHIGIYQKTHPPSVNGDNRSWRFDNAHFILWIDPVAAIIVALLIFKTAWDLTAESVRDLLDASLPV